MKNKLAFCKRKCKGKGKSEVLAEPGLESSSRAQLALGVRKTRLM